MALPPNPFGLSTERQDSHAVPRPQWGCSPRRCIDIVFTLCSHAFMGHLEDDLPFRVEQWDVASARLEQILSASADLHLGRAAFSEAVRRRPGQRILLRHGTLVIEEHQK